MIRTIILGCCLALTSHSFAVVSNWNTNNTTAGNSVNNLMLSGNWSNGLPADGVDPFMVWTRPNAGGPTTKIVTNAVTDILIADSLSITNTGKDRVFIYMKGQTFLTNGSGRLSSAGATGDGDITLAFSNTVTLIAAEFINGGGGAGVSTLNFAGALNGQRLVFNGGAGNNRLHISGPLSLGGALVITNLNTTSFGTLSGNATVGQLLINNAATNRLLIADSTTTVTGAVESVVGGFTLANNATLTIGSLATVTYSNVGPLIRGTINVNGGTLSSKLAWTNTSFISLGGGVMAGEPFVNTGSISGSGTITPNFNNLGTVTATAPGLNFAGVLTNTGWIAVNVTTARFANAVVNSGTMSFNPGVAFFGGNLTLNPSGVLTAAVGSVLHFRGDFVNNSTQSNAFNLSQTTTVFDGGGTVTQLFALAGLDLGLSYAGLSNNFALGTLVIGGGSTGLVQLTGSTAHALYVTDLTLDAGSTLLLNGLTIYTVHPAVLNGTVVADGGMILLIPEPSVLVLVGSGLLLLIAARRFGKGEVRVRREFVSETRCGTSCPQSVKVFSKLDTVVFSVTS